MAANVPPPLPPDLDLEVSRRSIFTINIKSLRRRIAEVRSFLRTAQPLILGVCETNVAQPDSLSLAAAGYSLYITPFAPPQRGLALYVSNDLRADLIHLPDCMPFEVLGVEVHLQNGSTFLFVLTYLTWAVGALPVGHLHSLLHLRPRVLMMGDFNSRHEDWGCFSNSRRGIQLVNYLQNNPDVTHLYPPAPTFIPTHGRPSVIDFALTTSSQQFSLCDVVYSFTSDHSPIYVSLGDAPVMTPSSPRWLLHKADWDKFRATLSDLIQLPPQPSLTTPELLDAAVVTFTNHIDSAMIKSIPRSSRVRPPPALSPEVLELIRIHHRCRRRYQRDRTPANYYALQAASRDAQTARRLHLQDKWESLLADPDNLNTFYKIQKCIKRRSNPAVPPLLNPATGQYIFSAPDKIELIATTSIAYPPPTTDPATAEAVQESLDHFQWDNPADLLPVRLTTPSEVKTVIKSLKIQKAPGPDTIPNAVLKGLPRKALVMLTYIINAILTISYFPAAWKTSKTIAIPKPGKDRRDPASYRPIALLSSLSKVAERIIYRRLMDFTLTNNILPNYQYGFRPGHGPPDQLHRVLTLLLSHLDHGHSCVGVSLDLAKAFDTVWHEGLIYKLITFNYPRWLVTLIRSYLLQRHFRLHSGNIISQLHHVPFGVPQGSVLGPLLFIIYTSDMPRLRFSQLSVYADDTFLFSHGGSAALAARRVQTDTNAIINYFDTWRLSVQPAKTTVVSFSNSGRRFPTVPRVRVKNFPVPYSLTMKYLGLTLDSSLRFGPHVRSITARTMAVFHLLSCFMRYHSKFDPAFKLLFYKVLLRPILVYAAPVFQAQLSSSNWLRFAACQHKILRACVTAPFRSRNVDVHDEACIPFLHDYVNTQSTKFFTRQFLKFPGTFIHPYRRRRRLPYNFHDPRPPEESEASDIDSPDSD